MTTIFIPGGGQSFICWPPDWPSVQASFLCSQGLVGAARWSFTEAAWVDMYYCDDDLTPIFDDFTITTYDLLAIPSEVDFYLNLGDEEEDGGDEDFFGLPWWGLLLAGAVGFAVVAGIARR